jgi:hypothetical protein
MHHPTALPAGIADTIASPAVEAPLDPGHIDPPTLSMVFGPNDSPLAGRAGKAVTGRAIGERLLTEAETSVSLKVQQAGGRGRGQQGCMPAWLLPANQGCDNNDSLHAASYGSCSCSCRHPKRCAVQAM